MMRSHAGTKRPHAYPPTREQDSLVRLSIRFDGSYCTVDPMESISMANYASINDGDAGTGVSEAGECNSIGTGILEVEEYSALGDALHGGMDMR